MKILRYSRGGQAAAYGVLDGDGTIRALAQSPFERPGEKIQPGQAVGKIGDVKVLSPCTPSKVVMVGANYRSHLEGTPPPAFPMIFLKPPSAVIGHDDTIVVPKVVEGGVIDYEAELTVVIGRRTPRHVPESKALDYVLGYTIGNDVSARDIQMAEMKTGVLLRGKGFDTFAPLGPVIETDVDPDDVTIEAKVNGVLGHRVKTKGDMIFPVRTLIADMSRCFSLEPGDVIMTGTTAYGNIKAGDVVEMTIDGIGTLRNKVANET